jgi:hypothetical protein
MGGLTLYGSLIMGIVLVIGRRLFPDNIVMWFASSDASIAMWREVIVAMLVGLAIVRQYIHNIYVQLVWGVAAIVLLRSGTIYFLDNPSFMYDSLLMLGAGTAFAVTALSPGADYVDVIGHMRRYIPKPWLVSYDNFGLPQVDTTFATWRYISDSLASNHRLTVSHSSQRKSAFYK